MAMDRDRRKNGPELHSLITPSASPRPPVASGSSIRSGSRFSSTPASTSDAPDLGNLREESTSRLLSVWASLADRYSLRVDEDDIVDIRTAQVVKDRGVVRGLTGKWDFGRFADVEEEEEEEEERGQEAEEAGESDDELDSFPQNAEAPPNPFMALSNLTSRATRAIDPKNDENDAADLRAFLEAERLRREVQGDVDESLSEDLQMEEGVTDADTEAEATEADAAVHESQDELEFWDDGDFDVIPSSEPVQPLLTPPNSQSEGYVDHIVPLRSSPPPLSPKTRSKSRARSSSSLPADQYPHLLTPAPSTSPRVSPKGNTKPTVKRSQREASASSHISSDDALNFVGVGPDTASQSSVAAPTVKTPSSSTRSVSSFPSSTSFTTLSKIPRIDLTQLPKLKRNGRSQSRSPSKLSQTIRQDVEKSSPVASSSKHASSSKPSTSSLRHSQPSVDSSMPKSKKSGEKQAPKIDKGKARAREDDTDIDRAKAKTVDVKGKGKAQEVIEITDSDDAYDTSMRRPPSTSALTRSSSTKPKGKKRARSSGILNSSEEEWDGSQQTRDVSPVKQQKPKPLGSPTKRGRYDLASDDLSAHHPTGLDESDFEVGSSTARKLPSRGALPTDHWRRDSLHLSSSGSQRGNHARPAHEVNADDPDSSERTLFNPPRPSSQSKPRVRTSSGPGSHPDSGAGFDESDHRGDYPMDSSFARPKTSSSSRNAHQSRAAAAVGHDYQHHPLGSMLPPPPPTAAEQFLKERAEHIVSSAIQGLYSLLTPEALSSALQEGSPSRRQLHSMSSNDEVDSVVLYTPRKSSGGYRHHRDLDSSMSSPPIPLSNVGSTSSSYTTPTSHRSRRQSQSHSYSFDPNYSRGTLPPSSPYSELDDDNDDNDDHHHRGRREHDEHDFQAERPFPTSSSSSSQSNSSPIRRHERNQNQNHHRPSHQREQSSRASSIVHRSRSRGRTVSFKETAITRTKNGETRRELSREISVEEPEDEVHREVVDMHRRDGVDGGEYIDGVDDGDEMSPSTETRSRRRDRTGTPFVTQRARQQLRQRSLSPALTTTQPELQLQPEEIETERASSSTPRRGPGRLRKFKDVDGRRGR